MWWDVYDVNIIFDTKNIRNHQLREGSHKHHIIGSYKWVDSIVVFKYDSTEA